MSLKLSSGIFVADISEYSLIHFKRVIRKFLIPFPFLKQQNNIRAVNIAVECGSKSLNRSKCNVIIVCVSLPSSDKSCVSA